MANIALIKIDFQHNNSNSIDLINENNFFRWIELDHRGISTILWYSYNDSSRQKPYDNTFLNAPLYMKDPANDTIFGKIIKKLFGLDDADFGVYASPNDVLTSINNIPVYSGANFCFFTYSSKNKVKNTVIISFLKHLRNSLAHGSFNHLSIPNKYSTGEEYVVLYDEIKEDGPTMGLKFSLPIKNELPFDKETISNPQHPLEFLFKLNGIEYLFSHYKESDITYLVKETEVHIIYGIKLKADIIQFLDSMVENNTVNSKTFKLYYLIQLTGNINVQRAIDEYVNKIGFNSENFNVKFFKQSEIDSLIGHLT